MTYVKLYTALWALLVIVAAGLAVTGNFSSMTAIVYGFISFGMIFMGMMSVLPSLVSTSEGRAALCGSKPAVVKNGPSAFGKPANALHEWLFPTGIEIGQPKHH
jgi:hypothetical protein